MSAASVLSSFSPSAMPGPVMPMDVAMRFYLSHSPPPLRGFLSSYEDLQRAKNRRAAAARRPALYKPLRPCLSAAAEQQDVAPPSGGQKKRVVFADSRGLALTAIHLFSPSEDEPGPVDRGRGQDLNPDLYLDLDRFGSPRLSSGFFPGWQSWSHTDTAVPYW